MRRTLYVFLIFTMGLILDACMSSSSSEAPLNTVSMAVIGGGPSAQWGDKEPGGWWIASEAQKEVLMNQLNRDASALGRTPPLPEIDFAEYGLLLICMGQQTTGGFALKLMAEEAEIEKRTAIVPVQWVEPKKGAMVAQVITNPFLIIQLAKGRFDQIGVVDHNGVGRLVLETMEK